MELLENLGINGKMLLAQIVNFFILLYVLKRFAYGPILKMLEERSEKIEKGISDSEKAQKKLTEIEEKERKVLAKAKIEAQGIIAKSEEVAERNKKEILEDARIKAEKIMTDTESKIDEERGRMLGEVKKEVAELVMLATEKIVGEKANNEKDREIINEVIKG